METVTDFIFLVMDREAWHAAVHGVTKSWARLSDWIELKITADGGCSHEIKRCLFLGRKVMANLDSMLKSWDKDPSSQSSVFSNRHVWMWELDHKEGWAPKNWCIQTVVLQKTPESPLDNKEIKPVNPKGNQPSTFIKGLMLKLKLQYFVHLNTKSQFTGKDFDAGKEWGQQQKGGTEDEIVGWSHRFNRHEFEHT